MEARVGFEPTNGGFAGQASKAGLFVFNRLGMRWLAFHAVLGQFAWPVCNACAIASGSATFYRNPCLIQ